MSYRADIGRGPVRCQDTDTQALKEYERRCEAQSGL